MMSVLEYAVCSMSALEDTLLFQIRAVGIEEPKREYRAIPTRRFKWDFCWERQRLLVECQGSVYVPNTGHSSGRGISRDAEKHNIATLNNWRQLTFTGAMVKDGTAIAAIEQALK